VSAPLSAAAGVATGRPGGSVVPAWAVRLKGSPLPAAVATDVVSLRVHQDVELPSMFTIRLINWDAELRRMTWSEPGWFDPGSPVEIQLGYTGRLQTVLTGEITGLELDIDAARPPMLEVRGYDRRHRLLRGQLTRSFVGVTDSGIAARIGTERGLAVRATPTAVRLDHVLQHNQTDLEFLGQRAHRIGYEVAIDDRTLLFRPRRRPQVPRARLERDQDLISFRPRLTTMGQTRGATVQGWNPAQPDQQLRGVAGGDDPRASGASVAGPPSPFPGALAVGNRTVLRPLTDKQEADALARGLAPDTEPWRIDGSGVCVGRPDVTAGEAVRIDGVGRRFSGTYTVTSATHTFDPSRGYRTAFEVRKEST
jgi:phage protein D